MPMEQQVYQNMASALGIDLSETEDIISQMVKLGIDDLDPTRVLRRLHAHVLHFEPAGTQLLSSDTCATVAAPNDGSEGPSL